MADYYGLLARAVQALRRNDKSSRLEIYAKARHALIRQLKAINPPLPPEEISKQRLALEEAIRRVEREAAEAAAAAMLSEEEIGRQAERALEEALAEDPAFGGRATDESLDEFGTDPYADPIEEPPPRAYRQPPMQARPAPPPERAYRPQPAERAYAPEPRAYRPPEERAYRQAPEERAYRQAPEERVYSPPPMPEERINYRQMDEGAYEPPRRQPEPQGRVQFEPPPRQAYRPEPEVMPPSDNYADPRNAGRNEEAYAEVVTPVRPQAPERSAGATTWNRAATVTDVEQPALARPSPANKQAERAVRRKRGGRGWERTQTHGKKQRWSTSARLAVAAVLLIAAAGAGYYAWTDWDNVSTFVTELITGKSETVEVVAQDVVDPATGEPVVFVEPAAYFYEEPIDGGFSTKYDATVVWSLVEDATLGPTVSAHIEVPRRGLTFDMQVAEARDPTASHEVSIAATVGRNGPELQAIDNIAVKTTEEGIGVELEGAVESSPNLYVLDLPAASAGINNNRLATSPWFDIALVYQSGQRAVLAFSKGTVGTGYFADAIAAWGAN